MNHLDYGIIGNCRSAALVSKTGAVEWFCLPDFSSSSVFAALLDADRGGTFAIDAGDHAEITQDYVRHTCVLRTHFKTPEGEFEVLDFMPRYKNDRLHYVCPSDLIRYIRHISGAPKVRFDYRPALGYGQYPTTTEANGDFIKSWASNGNYESIYLYTDMPDECVLDQQEHMLTQDGYFLISYNQKLLQQNIEAIHLDMERTKVYWLDWVQRTVGFAKYREEIIRSALTLKLLSYQKSGAILAAVTTSLPETIGEVRNWDYRFCWIRDASMTITVLTSIGHYNAAERFLRFIIDVVPYKDEKIQIMYGIRGEKRLTERELPWLRGYEDSAPVRVGNAAYKQKQNDIYGVLLDVIHKAFNLFGNDVEQGEDLWTVARTLVRSVEQNWKKPDRGIWEFRSQNRHFVFSKVLSWVAMDRGVKLAELLGRENCMHEWIKTRDAIKADIMKKGWNDNLGAFTQAYDNTALDAANLLMATYGFIDPKDPKFIATVERSQKELCRNGLMYRYKNDDDFGSPSSAFTVCSFWMVKALCQIGRKKAAESLFQNLLQRGNHLGLFSEDMDFETGRLLGNFPQGYSHLALIDSAIALAETKIGEDEQLLTRIEHPEHPHEFTE
jgi:GH15 family glucan-1,4-alpha-glucosidase